MKITLHNGDGTFQELDVNPSELSLDDLHYFAQLREPWASEELRNRIGLDPYKPSSEITKEDMDFLTKWVEEHPGVYKTDAEESAE